MADRGRDFKVAFLSDSSGFDAADPADQLDDLADSADDAAKKLDKLDGTGAAKALDKAGDAARGTGKDLDKLAADAKDTASKVDASFDAIARSAKTKIADPVDHETHKAGESFSEFKDEAKANLSEVASSFSGDMTSAADLVQGTLGGIVGSLGPVGAAIGAVGAIGVGIFNSQMQKAKERVDNLVDAIIAGQGKVDAASMTQSFQDFAKDGTLARIKKDADATGISFQTLARAYAGNRDALDEVLPRIRDLRGQVTQANGMIDDAGSTTNDWADSVLQVSNDLDDQSDLTNAAAGAADLYSEAMLGVSTSTDDATISVQAHEQAMADLADAVDGFADPAATYTQLLADKQTAEQESAQKTADATASQKDSWEDYAKDVTVSVDEYLAQLEKQVKAQEDWSTNLATLAKRGVDEGVLAQLARMGPEGAPLVAKLTTASAAELKKLVDLYGRQGASAGAAVAQKIEDSIPAANEATRALMAAVNTTIKNTVIQGVTVPITADPAAFFLQLGAARKRAAEELRIP